MRFRGGVVMTCAPHGNVARHMQQGQFHMHTPLFGDFWVLGWGFGVGLRGGVSGWGVGS